MLQKTKYVFLGIFIAALGLWGLAVTIPNTFSSGEVVSAAKMNQNFQALKDAVDTLEAKVATLEAELTALPERTAMPRAMALVASDGAKLNAYSITGNSVSPAKTGVGEYTVDFTGEDLNTATDPILVTAIQSGRVCGVVAYGGDGKVYVTCTDTSGSPADTTFHLLVFNK